MSTDFKYTGHPQPANTANIQGDGVIIPSPGPGKSIGILDILADSPCELRENDADGDLIAYVPKGSTRLDSCINAGMGNGSGNAVYCSSLDKACTIVWRELQNYPRQIGGLCAYINPTTPTWVTALEEALCDSDCISLSFGDPTFFRFLTKNEARTDIDDRAAALGEANKGPCGAVDCSDLAPTEFCYTLWCYDNPPRSAAGFMPILWGYTLCFGPAISSSPSSGYGY